jgi:hypothetical protein
MDNLTGIKQPTTDTELGILGQCCRAFTRNEENRMLRTANTTFDRHSVLFLIVASLAEPEACLAVHARAAL